MKRLQLLFILLILCLVFLRFLHPITALSQDLGRHLLLGNLILQTKNVPETNLFSYTYPSFPFINHHWFSEVIFYSITSISGLNVLLFLTTTVTTLAMFMLLIFSNQRYGIFPTILTSLFLLPVLFERTEVRPEIFSFLFVSLFVTILYLSLEKKTRWIFLLPAIELLWVNMHIYFIVGVFITLLFLCDALIRNRKRIVCNQTITLGKVFFLTAIATIANPNGINGVLLPFRLFQNYGYAIEENQNIFFLWQLFHKQTTVYFMIAVSTLLLILFFTHKKARAIDWFLFLSFTALAVSAERNFPLFVFAVFIPFSRNLSIASNKINHSIFSQTKKKTKNLISLLLIVVIAFQIFTVLSSGKVGFGTTKGADNAATFFIKNGLKGPIFNNFDIGSYLEYRLFPKEKVFVDGRPEAYPSSFFQDSYIQLQRDREHFENAEKKYNFNTIFFSHTDQTPWATQFIEQISQNQRWKLIYLDDIVMIFVKDTPSNKDLIARFGMERNSIRLSDVDESNTDSLIRESQFFKRALLPAYEQAIYQKILDKNPNSCFALYYFSLLLSQKNDPATSLYVNRFNQLCQ